MHYIYVIQSLKDNKLYTGYTNNLKRRIEEHNEKIGFSTKSRAPFKLLYHEACISKSDALAREKHLKSGRGKKYIKGRLKNFLKNTELGSAKIL